MDSYNLEALGKLFETRMQEYERKLQNVAEGSSVHTDVTMLSQDFYDFKSMIWQLFNNIKSQLESLSLGLDRHEMIMRKKVLLFHGIEEKHNEKLPEVIYQVIAEQLKLPDIPKSDLQVCHRLGVSAQAKSRPVLVRFTALDPRQAVWDAKTLLKGTGITISEFLTKTRHQIFLLARKHFGIKNCWSTEGRIVINLPDKARRKIETMASLQDIISKFPVGSGDTNVPIVPVHVSDSKSAKTTRSNRRK